MTILTKIVVLIAATASLAVMTRRSIVSLRSHGLYRLLAWVASIALVLLNLEVWFDEPYSLHQIASWLLLILAVSAALYGSVSLRRGLSRGDRDDNSLIGIEKTTRLVEAGAYRFVRHPIYCSFLLGGLGVLLKSVSLPGGLLTAAIYLAAIIAAKREERENIAYFGEAYLSYMKRTKMFIPFLY